MLYITSAYRAYEIADHYRSRGVYVVLGGLHVTSLPLEAAQHADTIFLGPGEDTWPQFLADFRQGKPQKIYQSKERSLVGVPPVRRDLIKRHLYLVPNSIVVSRGCPHHCDFCYKDAFYQEGKSFDQEVELTAEKKVNRVFENIDGIKFLNHTGGCGGTRQDAATLQNLLAAYADHPNVGGITVLSLGCQHLQLNELLDAIKTRNPLFDKPVFSFEQQAGLNWNVWYQPLGFLLFLTCALAECNRAPFDLAECETELIGGYHVEYSSMKLGFYLFSEYINMFISSAVIACVYFGGYNFPGMHLISDPMILGLTQVAVMFAKIFFFVFLFMWIRWTLPRFRYDQLMRLGWKAMIPLALLNMLATGAISLYNAQGF